MEWEVSMTPGMGEAYQPNGEPDNASLEAVEQATSILRKRWRSAILLLLASGRHRYNGLLRRFPGITAKVLTQQLRELEQEGLVVRTARNEGPRHVEYALTPLGLALRPAIEALAAWARVQTQCPPGDVRVPAPLVAHEREMPKSLRIKPSARREAPAVVRLTGNERG